MQDGPFDAGQMLNAFSAGHCDVGAVVSFTGLVRDLPGDPLDRMVIEHYPGMTQSAITDMAGQASDRWSLADVLVIHRYGVLKPGEQIMMVATAARHRNAAFEAAEFLMDYLKSRAPFWKQEITDSGATWVQALEQDEDQLTRW